VEAARRHDGENGLLRLFRLFLVGECEQMLGRIEDAAGGVFGRRADGCSTAHAAATGALRTSFRALALPPPLDVWSYSPKTASIFAFKVAALNGLTI
jgi:hypothetical protein